MLLYLQLCGWIAKTHLRNQLGRVVNSEQKLNDRQGSQEITAYDLDYQSCIILHDGLWNLYVLCTDHCNFRSHSLDWRHSKGNCRICDIFGSINHMHTIMDYCVFCSMVVVPSKSRSDILGNRTSDFGSHFVPKLQS